MSTAHLIKISQFGKALASRPEGREAALSTMAYHLGGKIPAEITLDFQDVIVMTPSWLGEFVQTLMSMGIKKVVYINTSPLVESSIEFIAEETRSSGS